MLGLAHDVDMAVADISGAFLHAVVEQPFYVKPPIEYRKLGIVWKVKRYLYGDKRAPRGWQDHFETTMLDLNSERLESEPGCFVKKGATPKDSIIVVVHVDDLLSVGKREKLDRFFMQLAEKLKIKHREYLEDSKPVLFLGDYITKYKDKITRKSKDTYVDNMLTMLTMEGCNPDVFQETSFRSALRGEKSGHGVFVTNRGPHETFEESLTLHSRNARRALGTDSAPRAADGGDWLV